MIILLWLIVGSTGVALTWFGGKNIYIKFFCCTRKVYGTFLSIQEHCTRRTYYTLEFSYCVEGRHYRKESFETYDSRRRLQKKYVENQEYPIYVSVKDPNVFVRKRSLVFGDVLLLLYGILCLCMVIYETVMRCI